ncbi:MAG: hypothetical protein ABGZ24_15210, partial [Fuerstiella sp.]
MSEAGTEFNPFQAPVLAAPEKKVLGDDDEMNGLTAPMHGVEHRPTNEERDGGVPPTGAPHSRPTAFTAHRKH